MRGVEDPDEYVFRAIAALKNGYLRIHDRLCVLEKLVEELHAADKAERSIIKQKLDNMHAALVRERKSAAKMAKESDYVLREVDIFLEGFEDDNNDPVQDR